MECAVISTNAGGIKEVIRHEKDGFLCEVENWEYLPEYAEKLIKDPVLLKSYKENARLRVKENFSLKIMVNSLEEYYLQTFKATRYGD